MGTREKIIDSSIKLFNENRATNVSTVQIANDIGISSGNLYYYFKNKEHIIRTIWNEEISKKMDIAFYDTELSMSENGILQFFKRIAKYTYKYRFFYLEIYSLLSNDPKLKDAYMKRSSVLMDQIRLTFDTWISIGIMKPITENEKKFLLQNCWTLGQVWITYSEIIHNNISLKEMTLDEIFHIYYILKPYFTDTANDRIQKLIDLTKCNL